MSPERQLKLLDRIIVALSLMIAGLLGYALATGLLILIVVNSQPG